MSLFGSSPDDSSVPKPPVQSEQKSLFDDEQTARAASNTSLFDDSNGSGNSNSPWSMPTPKRAGRGDLAKTLLPASDVPESYIDAFDIILESGFRVGPGSINLAGAKKVFEGRGISKTEQDRILNLVVGGQESVEGLGRSEFNVILALAGLSQEREEATFDGVDERRRSKSNLSMFPFPVVRPITDGQ